MFFRWSISTSDGFPETVWERVSRQRSGWVCSDGKMSRWRTEGATEEHDLDDTVSISLYLEQGFACFAKNWKTNKKGLK